MKSKWLVAALASAFVGATAYAADSSTKDSDATKGTSSNPMTSYDTGKTGPASGAEGVKTTPSASDEDHNDSGGNRGRHHSLPHRSSKDVNTSNAANDAEHQPTPHPSAAAGGRDSVPAGIDNDQQKSTNGR